VEFSSLFFISTLKLISFDSSDFSVASGSANDGVNSEKKNEIN